jgi:hypothetical protein
MSGPTPQYKKYAAILLMLSGFICFSSGASLTILHLLFGTPSLGWKSLVPLLAGLPLIALGSHWLVQPFRKLAGFMIYLFAYTAFLLALVNIRWMVLSIMTKPLFFSITALW